MGGNGKTDPKEGWTDITKETVFAPCIAPMSPGTVFIGFEVKWQLKTLALMGLEESQGVASPPGLSMPGLAGPMVRYEFRFRYNPGAPPFRVIWTQKGPQVFVKGDFKRLITV